MAQLRINSLINLGLPANVPDAFKDPEVRSAVEIMISSMNNFVEFMERYGGITQKDITTWDSLTPRDTILPHQLQRFYIEAGAAISFGNLVNIYDDAGTTKIRKANAVSGTVRPARGFCSTVGGIASGSRGEIILSNGLLNVTGVAAGDILYLSKTTPGGFTTSAPVAAGDLTQFVGFGIATDLAYIQIAHGPYVQN